MGSQIPKQFLEIKGRPILMHTIEAFYHCPGQIKLILVLPETHITTWKELCDRYQFKVPVTLQSGGPTRFQSVMNGLALIEGDGLVAIHDGVRPLVDRELIERSFQTAMKNGSGVAAIPVKNSIREITPNGSRSVDRHKFCMVQTPQAFKVGLIKLAYQNASHDSFTDDASVWETAGYAVTLFEGSEKNLKITTVQDLAVAEMLIT